MLSNLGTYNVGIILIKKHQPGVRGAFGSVVYQCVNKKNDEKGYFFFELGSAQCCHNLG